MHAYSEPLATNMPKGGMESGTLFMKRVMLMLRRGYSSVTLIPHISTSVFLSHTQYFFYSSGSGGLQFFIPPAAATKLVPLSMTIAMPSPAFMKLMNLGLNSLG